jgi:glycine reductase
MAKNKLRVVHYLNQFFGQVGAEDKAHISFIVKAGPIGPGIALQSEFGDRAELVATIICGDNYFSRSPEQAAEEGLKLIEPYQPAIFFAGPAFEAGRYGISCGAICKAVEEKLHIPVITGMYCENPGVEMYRHNVFICKTGSSVRDMNNSLKKMSRLALKLISGERVINLVTRENIPNINEYEYYPQLILRNEYNAKSAAERSVDKLLAKIRGELFESEVVLPDFEKIKSPLPLKELSKCEIALVSDGGLVPRGNPDGLSSRGNLRWTTYEIDDFLPEDFNSHDYEIAHTGYFPDEVLENPNRLVPVDVIRDLVKESKIGKLHPTFFCTSGNVTAAQRCKEMGQQIGAELRKRKVDGVILTST